MIEPGTPLPWIELKVQQGDARRIFSGSQFVGVIGGTKDSPKQIEANAKFIVRACNAYHKLLNAIRQAERTLDNERIYGEPINTLRDLIEEAELRGS